MKEIRAIIRPNRLDRLRVALRAVPNFPGVTVFRAAGFTAPASLAKRTVKDELTDFTDKVVVSVLCEASMVEEIRNVIFDACSTGTIGDGLVWVVDVQAIHRIRDQSAMG